MKRFVIPIVVLVALIFSPVPAHAGTGSPPQVDETSRATDSIAKTRPGSWSPWERVVSGPADLSGLCSESVHLDVVPVDRVVQRTRLDRGGNTEIESKGRLVVTLTVASQPGRKYTFDISGPSLGRNTQIAYQNGDYLLSGNRRQSRVVL